MVVTSEAKLLLVSRWAHGHLNQFSFHHALVDNCGISECVSYVCWFALLINRSTPLTCSMALADCRSMAGSESCMRSEELLTTMASPVRYVYLSLLPCPSWNFSRSTSVATHYPHI